MDDLQRDLSMNILPAGVHSFWYAPSEQKRGWRELLSLTGGLLTPIMTKGVTDSGVLVVGALFMQSTTHKNASPHQFSVVWGHGIAQT